MPQIDFQQFTVGTIGATDDWFSWQGVDARILNGLGAIALLVAVHADNTDGSQVFALGAVGTNSTDVASVAAFNLEQSLVHNSVTGDQQLYRVGGGGATIKLAALCPYSGVGIQLVPLEANGPLHNVLVSVYVWA